MTFQAARTKQNDIKAKARITFPAETTKTNVIKVKASMTFQAAKKSGKRN